MGHLFSKSSPNSLNGNSNAGKSVINNINTPVNTSETNKIPIPQIVGPTINFQIQESPSKSINAQLSNSSSSSLSSRQIIIKIQLAKMENGNGQQAQEHQLHTTFAADCSADSLDANSNQDDGNSQIVNVTLNGKFVCGELTDSHTPSTSNSIGNSATSRALSLLNNNLNNSLMGRINSIQITDDLELSTTESAEYCEMLETQVSDVDGSFLDDGHTCEEEPDDLNKCCRRKPKSNSSAYLPKRRCCKCKCREAFKRILEPSAKSNKSKERKEQNHSSTIDQVVRQLHHLQSNSNAAASSNNSTPISITEAASANNSAMGGTNQLSFWTPTSNDVIIPISSPQFLLVQCPPTTLVTLERIDENGLRLMTREIEASSVPNTPIPSTPQPINAIVNRTSNGPIVHSQVDFEHRLVPDLEKITNSSFYWGKMDRYEAERLLDAKPEGTFLLRDSAQEEFLFSVTFRKYGRSLHARIEQSNHKFSFDCHDPGVFTARTVTGLLEHYKDPTCVMFFEPMLAIPLHRKTTFSLQQLCRATIVSNTTYDGINKLETPARLKSYLKEYHYKQKLRSKPFDELFYSCT